MLQLDKSYRDPQIFVIFPIETVQIWVLRGNKFFFSIWLIFYPLDPDPWIRIFISEDADPDPDLDPKHWIKH